MNASLLGQALAIAHILLVLAMVCAAIRLAWGPRAQDRVLALDTLYINAMLIMLTFGMRQGNVIYFEAALVIGMLGFVATVALAKFLMRGEVIE
jgi:multicomponent K+:H+ antiporter subunit F